MVVVRGIARWIALSDEPDMAQLVCELRKRFGLTQEKFAAKLCVTFPTINRWENGQAKPPPLTIQSLRYLIIATDRDG
jgi:transcriptional regulator with XRE-family HTH domain